MDAPERRALVLHPPHRWRGIQTQHDTEFGKATTLGWFTIEIISIDRLTRMTAQLRDLLRPVK